jgi:signal transduction histidine kinase
VQQAAAAQGAGGMPYVMGDDPERMDGNAVIAARPLKRSLIRSSAPVAGYLYLVSHKPPLPAGRLEMFRSSLAGPALAVVAAVVALCSLLAAWIVAAVTRPLRALSADVARATRDGLGPAPGGGAPPLMTGPGMAGSADEAAGSDEFGQLRQGFGAMLATLRMQWDQLNQLDHFRREGVSNLSHDLRSPLTATVTGLETLERRWQGDAARAEDRQLVEMALRNTRNAARLVRSLGDLAQLDEPAFKLHPERLDVGEVLDDIALRFANRAAQLGVVLVSEPPPDAAAVDAAPPVASVDIELFERAVANLIDNALKFTPAGGRIVLRAEACETGAAGSAGTVRVSVADSGAGIAEADLPRLFDRLYQARDSVAPATGEGGKGLGLAIVKRIAELHRGSVAVTSQVGLGTTVTLTLPSLLSMATSTSDEE